MSVILHSDLNCFYASVEMNEQPQLKGKKVAVCGSTENRHGIVLTASYPAKRSGVKTGMANWQAKQACPGLIMVDPHYDLYLKYSRIVRRIYQRYSEIIEPFGMDENWIQLPFTNDVEGIGFRTAEEIRKTVESETGLTVSIGVSFSKIFAKLGSDMKKPNAVTVRQYQRHHCDECRRVRQLGTRADAGRADTQRHKRHMHHHLPELQRRYADRHPRMYDYAECPCYSGSVHLLGDGGGYGHDSSNQDRSVCQISEQAVCSHHGSRHQRKYRLLVPHVPGRRDLYHGVLYRQQKAFDCR